MPQPRQSPPDPAPAPEPSPEPSPSWAADLKRAIDELPGRLKVTLSDQDHRSIFEGLHGLFEQSGAFEKHPEPASGKPGQPGAPSEPASGEPGPGEEQESLARRLFGRY